MHFPLRLLVNISLEVRCVCIGSSDSPTLPADSSTYSCFEVDSHNYSKELVRKHSLLPCEMREVDVLEERSELIQGFDSGGPRQIRPTLKLLK